MTKINISILPETLLDYTNHSVAQQQHFNLDVDDNELEEILALNVIEYAPRNMFEGILQHWVSKLAHKAKLTVSFADLYTVSRLCFLQTLNVQQVNEILHGNGKQNNLTVPQLTQILERLGLRVLSKKLDGIQATIEAERP